MNVQSALLAHFRDATSNRKASPELEQQLEVEHEFSQLDPIISAAVLVAGAFRMRDEAALISTLRLLTSAVSTWEARRPEPANDC